MKKYRNILLGSFMMAVLFSCQNDDDNTPSTLPEPVLNYPVKNQLCTDNTINFQWEGVQNTDVTYTLRVYTDYPDESQYEEVKSLTQTSYTMTLDKGKIYAWKVFAENQVAQSETPTYQFYTEGDQIVNYAPYAAERISPKEYVESTKVNLQWTAFDIDEDLLTYDVYLGQDSILTNLVAEDLTENSLEVQIDSANYYWRVDTKDNFGNKTIGQIWKFDFKTP